MQTNDSDGSVGSPAGPLECLQRTLAPKKLSMRERVQARKERQRGCDPGRERVPSEAPASSRCEANRDVCGGARDAPRNFPMPVSAPISFGPEATRLGEKKSAAGLAAGFKGRPETREPEVRARGRSPRQIMDTCKRQRHRSKNPRAGAATFVEVFAGVAGLTAAVKRRGMPATALTDWDPTYTRKLAFDLLRTSDFNKLCRMIKRGKVKWLHAAPPCKTFSRARRKDKYATCRVLRSIENRREWTLQSTDPGLQLKLTFWRREQPN